MTGNPALQRFDSAEPIIDLLERARGEGASGVAFDADGTLWSGDVGEDVFEHAYTNGLLRDAARAPLAAIAAAHGIDTAGSASALAQALHEGYRRGVVAELLTCELMTFCYADFTLSELTDLARVALVSRGLEARRRTILSPIIAYARKRHLRVVVVSASPRTIVAEGLRITGIEVDAIGAADPVIQDGRIEPRLASPVPYGAEKPNVGTRLLGSHDWLATFGDNVFDLEMLRIAKIGVAVHPKPALAARLGELTNTVVLE